MVQSEKIANHVLISSENSHNNMPFIIKRLP